MMWKTSFFSGNFDEGFRQRWSQLSLNNETLEQFSTLLERVRVHSSKCEQMAKTSEKDPTEANMDASIKVLKATIYAGHVDPRCSIGQQFTAEHRPGAPQGDLYRAKSREDATKFRLEWAQQHFDLMRQGKYFKQKWQRVDRKNGQYMSFEKLVQK